MKKVNLTILITRTQFILASIFLSFCPFTAVGASALDQHNEGRNQCGLFLQGNSYAKNKSRIPEGLEFTREALFEGFLENTVKNVRTSAARL